MTLEAASMRHVVGVRSSLIDRITPRPRAVTQCSLLETTAALVSDFDWIVGRTFFELCSRSYCSPLSFAPTFVAYTTARGHDVFGLLREAVATATA